MAEISESPSAPAAEPRSAIVYEPIPALDKPRHVTRFPKILTPPYRFSIVEEGIYRGGHPSLKNYRLRLKSIVSLTAEEPCLDLLEFCTHENVKNFHFEVNNDKEKVALRTQTVVQVLQVIIDPANLPLYVHCSNGVRATGILVMCLRKLQRWNLAAIFSEFCRYTREGEISRQETQFVESFRADITIPHNPPPWLLHGPSHPDFRLHMAAATPTSAARENPAKMRSAQIKHELTTRAAGAAAAARETAASALVQALCLETVTTLRAPAARPTTPSLRGSEWPL